MRISLITTVRDNPSGLSRVIDKFRHIADPDARMIVVDDGSLNPICIPKHPYIRLLTPGRIGRGAALNLAIGQAEHGLIAINDADDLPRTDRFEVARQRLRDRHGVLATPADGDHPRFRNMVPVSHLFRTLRLPHSGISFSVELWRRVGGYDETLPCCIDLDFLMRAAAKVPLLYDSRPAIRRDGAGGGGWFRSHIDQGAYLRTLRDIRARHRSVLRPCMTSLLWDAKGAVQRWRA